MGPVPTLDHRELSVYLEFFRLSVVQQWGGLHDGRVLPLAGL
jgi:hypothetical protein